MRLSVRQPKKLDQIRKAAQISNIRSLSEPVQNEDSDTTLEECIASHEELEESVNKAVDTEEMKRALWIAVGDLPEKETAVIHKIYLENMTRAAAGKYVGLSLSETRTLENRALIRLGRSHRTLYRRYYEEYISAADISHTGLRSFKTTWWSETERLALKG